MWRSLCGRVRVAFVASSRCTSSSSLKSFLLYSTPDCTLCVHFKRQLKSWEEHKGLKLDVEERNLRDQDTDLINRFKYDVPVLVTKHDGRVVMKHRFSSLLLDEELDLDEDDDLKN